MGPPRIDIPAALALAGALSVPAEIAAVLLMAAADGVQAGLADRKDADA